MRPSYLSYEDLDMSFVENEYKALVAELEKENEERRRLKDPNKPELKIPRFASRKQLSDAILKEAEEKIKEELKTQGKPERIWDNIIPGKMNSFIADNSQLDSKLTLMGQFYVMDDKNYDLNFPLLRVPFSTVFKAVLQLQPQNLLFYIYSLLY